MMKLKYMLPLLFCLIVQNTEAQERLGEVALFQALLFSAYTIKSKKKRFITCSGWVGHKNCPQACTEVLDKAKFTADSGTKKFKMQNNPTAKAVLSSMHQLHRS